MDPKLFGRYQIVRKLAGGGMGRVFLAYDPVLNRHVGLKLIDSGGDRESIDVITAERRGAILQDQLAKREPGGRVAQIFDVGEREGYFYIAMEYIEGEDLSELIARGPMEPARAVGIALDVLEVLSKAHHFQTMIEDRPHRSIIHGDIKPRNIRITTSGQVKVLDFGIAKAVSMTRSITFNQFGSVPYSSPERLQTGDMDTRSDVWAVAAVLFEMLTGKPYFAADQSSKLEWMIRNYRALQPAIGEVPPVLRGILSKALDPAPERRFASAEAFAAALRSPQMQAFQPTASQQIEMDPDATRRTVRPDSKQARPRAASPVKPQPSPQSDSRPAVAPLRRVGIATLVALFLGGVFVIVYEVRMWGNADALRRQIDSGQLDMGTARVAYDSLAKQSLFSLPLYPARVSLRDRYSAEADRVIADYREASESTPVKLGDWRRAQTALNSALTLAPTDRTIRGKSRLVDGNLRYIGLRDMKGARADFEEARTLLPHSPDPNLGLAFIYMSEGDLDRAEDELNQAKRNGFRPGRREQRYLGDGYRIRGERWLTAARRAHDIGQMQDELKHAESDLAHAEDLYNQVAPFLNGPDLAQRVANERDGAVKLLNQAQQARNQQNANQGSQAVAEAR